MGGLLAQVWEARTAGPALVTWPQLGSRRPVVALAVAWRHAPAHRITGDFVVFAARHDVEGDPVGRQLRTWLDSLGGRFFAWSGPEGAAVGLVVPRPLVEPALAWLYTALAHLPLGEGPDWQRYYRRYQRQWEGFSLKRDLLWRLEGEPPLWAFTPQDVSQYVGRYLQPESLVVVVMGSLPLRQKRALQQKRFHPPVASARASERREEEVFLVDSCQENLWAYPAYVALWLRTPRDWGERIAFVAAFLERWHRQAPPLAWEGTFYGPDRYRLFARVEGRGYAFLRTLRALQPRDSAEIASWQAAYSLFRARLYTYPERYPDVWIAGALRGDSLALPDTVPGSLLQRGWPFQAQGLWLYNELVLADTLLEPRWFADSDTLSQPVSPPDELVVGEPPLAAWASALRLYWRVGCPPCELIGYVRKAPRRTAKLTYLHRLRRQLIQQYGVPPEALRVYVQPTSPDFPDKAVRLRCYTR